MNLSNIIKTMKKNDTKVKNLNNGWNIKAIGDYKEYELFNDEENTIINCKNIKELEEANNKVIWVNPKTPDYMDFKELDERSDSHMNEWWMRPYVRTEDFGEDIYEEYYERCKEFGDVRTEPEFDKWREEGYKQWLEWWPDGKRYDVRILNGGAHDRTTNQGHYKTLQEAIERAEELQGTKSIYEQMMEQAERIQ